MGKGIVVCVHNGVPWREKKSCSLLQQGWNGSYYIISKMSQGEQIPTNLNLGNLRHKTKEETSKNENQLALDYKTVSQTVRKRKGVKKKRWATKK